MGTPERIADKLSHPNSPIQSYPALPAWVPEPQGLLLLLYSLASHPDADVRSDVLSATSLSGKPASVEALAAAVRRFIEVDPSVYNLSYRHTADLERLAASVLRALAISDTTPTKLLEELAKVDPQASSSGTVHDMSAPRRVGSATRVLSSWVRDGVAENRRTPPETLSELARDSDPWVRFAAATNPNTPIEALIPLAGDQEVLIRVAVADSPRTDQDQRLALAVTLSQQYPGDPHGLEEAVNAVLG